jgi:SNF2 family DNA or RNA helicase
MTTVELDGTNLLVRTPQNDLELIKARNIPQRRWNKSKKAWVCRASLTNMDYIMMAWPKGEWSNEAKEAWFDAKAGKDARDRIRDGKNTLDLSLLDHVPFKYHPMEHQKKALLLGRNMPYFAYLMDQGTGKTKVAIDDAAHNWREDRIDAMLVIAPNSVKTNWVMLECHKEHPDDKDALEDHMAPDVPVVKGVWISQGNKEEKAAWKKFENDISRIASERTRNSLVVLSVNVDALNVTRCFEFLRAFVNAFRTMIVCDESTRLKNRTSKRTKAAMKLRSPCPVARILSGTPVVKRPLDAFSQFGFLHEDILGFGNFYSFRNHYAIMGGFKDYQILNYKNLDELSESIASCSYRVTKEECLDLPPKVYLKRRVKMAPTQMKAYKQMTEELLAEWKDDVIEAPIVLTQLLRFQEIVGGYLPMLDEAGERIGTHELVPPSKNPKMQDVMAILDEAGDQQFIIWSRFNAEIEALYELLTKAGYRVAKFHGATKERERIAIRKAFARGELDGIVGNQSAGGIGIDEFKAASIIIYFSNSYDTEQRIQSEDRTHRIGSEIHDKITYFDLLIPGTVDVKIVATMRRNVEISTQIMKDGIRSWI